MKDFRGVQIGAVGNGLSGHDFVLWGDSHGMAVAQAVDDSARSAGLRGEAFLLPGVPPVTGLWFGEMEEDERNDLMARNLALVDWMILNRVPNVILVGRWVSFCNGYTEAEVEGREAGYRWTPTVLDEVGQSPGPGVSAAVLTRQLTVMATRLRAAGVEVWLVKQVPETNNLNTARQVSMLKRFPMLNQLDAFTTTRAEHEQRQASTEKAIAEVPLGLLEIIDPEAVFFEGSDQLRIYEERSIYRDDDHLTRFGAQRLMGPVFDELFLKIKEGR